MDKIKILTLVENHMNIKKGLVGEHGLALYIEADGKKILFDTGQSELVLENAKRSDVNLNDVDSIILSHGHYDHTGGLIDVLNKLEDKKNLFAGQGFFNKKYKGFIQGELIYNGNPFDEKKIKNHDKVVFNEICDTPYKISENIILYRGFDQINDFEELNSNFCVFDTKIPKVDDFSDEIVMVINTEKGLIVIVGCSHIGVVNIVESIINKIKLPVRGIIGGTHLINARELRVQKTIEYFKNLDLEFLAVSHCTGDENISVLKEVFKEKFIFNITGNQILL